MFVWLLTRRSAKRGAGSLRSTASRSSRSTRPISRCACVFQGNCRVFSFVCCNEGVSDKGAEGSEREEGALRQVRGAVRALRMVLCHRLSRRLLPGRPVQPGELLLLWSCLACLKARKRLAGCRLHLSRLFVVLFFFWLFGWCLRFFVVSFFAVFVLICWQLPLAGSDLALTQEWGGFPIIKCHVNSEWLLSCWGKPFYEKVKKKPIVCSGENTKRDEEKERQ
jgi:hypothetical protein